MVSLLKKCFYSRWSLQVRMAYVAFKADLKARNECHTFVKYYKCKNFCDRCDAIQPFTNVPVRLTYKNMSPTAPYVGTEINHDQYMATTLPRHVSPWERHVENWQFETCVFDFMHVVYLGVARDLVPSCFKLLQHLGYGCEDGETDDVFLKRVTMEMRATCKLFGTLSSNLFFPQAFGTFFYRTGGILCFCNNMFFYMCGTNPQALLTTQSFDRVQLLGLWKWWLRRIGKQIQSPTREMYGLVFSSQTWGTIRRFRFWVVIHLRVND